MRTVKMMVIGILVAGVVAGTAWGAVPTPLEDYAYYINVQGRVTDKSDANVPDGYHELVFTLQRSEVGALPAWVDTGWTETKRVIIKNGIFNVILGDVTPFPVFDKSSDYQLRIRFDGEDMDPPQPMVAVPLALTARNLRGGTVNADGGTGIAVFAQSSGGYAVHGQSDTTDGIHGVGARGGVLGYSSSGYGVYGTSGSGYGVMGKGGTGAKMGVVGLTSGLSIPTMDSISGVYGESHETTIGVGVRGKGPVGVRGDGTSSHGVYGKSDTGSGGYFESTSGYGVMGESDSSSPARAGVYGISSTTVGVRGETSGTLYGVLGYNSGTGNSGTGVFGETMSDNALDAGVYAKATQGAPALFAWQANTSSGKNAVYALASGNANAVYAQSVSGIGVYGSSIAAGHEDSPFKLKTYSITGLSPRASETFNIGARKKVFDISVMWNLPTSYVGSGIWLKVTEAMDIKASYNQATGDVTVLHNGTTSSYTYNINVMVIYSD